MLNYLIFIFISFIIYRIYSLSVKRRSINKKSQPESTARCIKTMICLGSGGHTKEMITILNEINPAKYTPRVYILADTDTTSESKLIELEDIKYKNVNHDYTVIKLKRSRHVNQSYVSSVFTTIKSILDTFPIMYREQPNLLLTNGPGTCVPLCLVAYLFKMFYMNLDCKVVFIESYCRVKSLSLSGKILLYFVDLFVVNWPRLQDLSRSRIEYFGRLM